MTTETETALHATLAATPIPPHIHGGLLRWAVAGIRPGHYVRACLAGDETSARWAAGDDLPADCYERIRAWAQANLPRFAWGAYAAVDAWRGLDAERKRGAA